MDAGGDIVEVGEANSVGPVVELNIESFSNTFRAWANYIEERGAFPNRFKDWGGTNCSILKDDGLYALITVVPVPIQLNSGYGIVINVHKKPVKLMSSEQLSEGALDAIRQARDYLSMLGGSETNYELLPPPVIGSCLEPAPWGGIDLWLVCEEWHLEEGPQHVAYDVPIPLVATVIKTSAYDDVFDVYLHEFVVAKEDADVRVGIAAIAGVTASGASGGVTYEVAGIGWEATTSEWASLSYGRFFTPGEDFSGPSILYVGFRGDISIAPYRLYTCIYPLGRCWPHDKWANITYTRPANNGPLNNDIAVHGSVNLYNYSDPLVKQYFDMVEYG